MPRERFSSEVADPQADDRHGAGRALQFAFFRRMGLSQQFRLLFDALPEVFFFAKDRWHRFVAASPEIVRRLGAETEEDLLGRRDRDFLPAKLCAHLEADDRSVLVTGQPMRNRLEVWYDSNRVLDWFVTSKFPIRDDGGKIIGVMGIVRPHEGKEGRRQHGPGGSGISRAVEFIRRHLGRAITIADLASAAGVSRRHLHRKFIEAFGLSAQEFILCTRIQAASAMLAARDKSLAEIAGACGFYDQSAFTRQFRKELGITPAAFQKQHLSTGKAQPYQTLAHRSKTVPWER